MSDDDLTHTLEEIGQSIARYRINAGMTQAEVAEKLGIGNDAVSRLERGKIDLSVGRLLSLSDLFNCSAAELIGGSSLRLQDHSEQVLRILMSIPDNKERREALAIFRKIVQFKSGKG